MVRSSSSGFTLIELLVAVAILGILATVAIPSYVRSLESSKGRESEMALRAILEAERSYYFDVIPNSYGTVANLIPTYLLVSPDSANWTYGINAPGVAPFGAFIATATRQSGSRSGQTRTITQAGVIAPATW